jgi:hypothetical protein
MTMTMTSLSYFGSLHFLLLLKTISIFLPYSVKLKSGAKMQGRYCVTGQSGRGYCLLFGQSISPIT